MDSEIEKAQDTVEFNMGGSIDDVRKVCCRRWQQAFSCIIWHAENFLLFT